MTVFARESTAIDILTEQASRFGEGAGESIVLDGVEVGTLYDDDMARYCCLAPIVPADLTLSRAGQAADVFEFMAATLAKCDMDFVDTVRTWFYMDELLDWYGEFNEVRTSFFKNHGVFDRLVPASTGIGTANPAGAALIAGLIAVKPKDDRVMLSEVKSPLQGSALDYRSSFSRALEVATPDSRTIYISGTASIDKGGRSIHLGDARRQIQETMEVVNAILESSGMSWDDAARGVVYYPNTANHELFLEYCQRQHIPDFDLSVVASDVCRKELLFEIEWDAHVSS